MKIKLALKPYQKTHKLADWTLNEQQQKLVDASGLGSLARLHGFVVDHRLITSFCECWRNETNTAHFSSFEMAPSLKDVSYILGLPVTGHAVVGEPLATAEQENVCLKYLGRIPEKDWLKYGVIRLAWLYDEFHVLPENPGTDIILYSTRAYLLYLIGCTIFAESMKGFVSPRFLPLLGDFDKIKKYAWGAAALAHLYRGLSAAAKPGTKFLSGCSSLLVAWIYEYMPATQPKFKKGNCPLFPCASKWMFVKGNFGNNYPESKRKSFLEYRKFFELLRESDVNWNPYEDANPSTLPDCCRASDYISHARTWLISFNIKEIYAPERYTKQFGEGQQTPDDVPRWSRVSWSASTNWGIVYANEIKEFEVLAGTCDIPPFKFKEKVAARRYEEWYNELVGHTSHAPAIQNI